MKPAVVNLLQLICSILLRLRVIGAILLSSLLLSGCVQYDVGVNVEGQHRGAIVQHIKLGEKLTSFSNEQATEWLRSIERRAKELEGKTKRLSDDEIVVTIPFNNGKELESKFNQFFNPVAKKQATAKASEAVDLPKLDSKIRINQNNFLLMQRNTLIYDLDLRSLGVLSANGNVIVSPNSLLDLKFNLETPWGARSINKGDNAIRPEVHDNGHQLVWTLQPGQLNHLEAAFWVPSPLGIGALVIVLLVVGGFFLKYQSFPGQLSSPVTSATLVK